MLILPAWPQPHRQGVNRTGAVPAAKEGAGSPPYVPLSWPWISRRVRFTPARPVRRSCRPAPAGREDDGGGGAGGPAGSLRGGPRPRALARRSAGGIPGSVVVMGWVLTWRGVVGTGGGR